MKLDKKKRLAAKTLGVGQERVVFNRERLDEIKEIITKQDVRDLVASGAISIREIKGSRTVERRKTRRRTGSIRKKVKPGKRAYVLRTRKLRAYIAQLLKQGKVTKEQYLKLRKEIRASIFRNKSHMKEHMTTTA